MTRVVRPFAEMAKSSVLLLLIVALIEIRNTYCCYRRKPARIAPFRYGIYQPWSKWSQCSVTCGNGSTSRRRRCSRRNGCEYNMEIEMQTCSLPVCQDVGVWTAWSPCPSDCGIPGFTERARQCAGGNCPLLLQRKPCVVRPCTPVSGGWSTWGAWSQCSVTCGAGEQYRQRTCTQPEPQYGGAHCGDDYRQAKICFMKKFCQSPVDGGWSSWSSWSSCSETCGRGTHSRTRTCSSPAPAFGGKPCEGSNKQTESCVLKEFCGPPVHGGWTKWAPWTVCSVRCGSGTKNRFRLCKNPIPSNGGRSCTGEKVQLQPCFNKCPVDGGWSKWELIKPCTSVTKKPCSLGYETSIRTCNNPTPEFGGRKCVGEASLVLDCWDDKGCPTGLSKPLDFHAQSFNNMTVLVKWREAPYGDRATNFAVNYLQLDKPETDARSVMTTRKIPGPSTPPSGSRYSLLLDVSAVKGPTAVWVQALVINPRDSKQAATERHTVTVGEIDGGWGSWQHWGPCSVTCGIGSESRKRRCDSPAPSSGGRQCPGSATEERVCDSGAFCR